MRFIVVLPPGKRPEICLISSVPSTVEELTKNIAYCDFVTIDVSKMNFVFLLRIKGARSHHGTGRALFYHRAVLLCT